MTTFRWHETLERAIRKAQMEDSERFWRKPLDPDASYSTDVETRTVVTLTEFRRHSSARNFWLPPGDLPQIEALAKTLGCA